MITSLALILLCTGVCILVAALIPLYQLIRQLPVGMIRRKWIVLTLLILLFIGGYLVYLSSVWNRIVTWDGLLVPAVFFSGAGFVWLTVNLALQTAMDVRRVTILEHENITDPLMGIYNRRYLDRRLEEEFSRARRYDLPLSILMLDIDHFKQINDTYGHSAGDHVLHYLADLLLHGVRESDIIARYGGEELLVIIPNTGLSAAASLAERLRQHVETHQLILSSEPNQRQEIRITVSIGVSTLFPEVRDCANLIHLADEALYRAKKDGRNRVVVYDASLASPVVSRYPETSGSATPGLSA